VTDHRVPLGRAGEKVAEDFLRRRGHRVLERRFRTRRGEVDLITRSGDHLYFVEVKTRTRTASRDDFGGGFEAISWRKRRSMDVLTRTFVARRRLEHLQPHVAVLTVEPLPTGARVRFLPDAFEGAA